MKVDAARIRDERLRRAWSQEQLADVAGLGLRTIQRIEKGGAASQESASALASVFGLPVDTLLILHEPQPSRADRLLARRFWILAGLVPVVVLLTPPRLTEQMALLMACWCGFEAVVAVTRWRESRE